MTHLDQVQALFPDNKVLGVLDSPLYMDLDGISWFSKSLKAQMMESYDNFNP